MTPAGIEPATFRFVAKHFNHCATASPLYVKLVTNVRCMGTQRSQHKLSLYGVPAIFRHLDDKKDRLCGLVVRVSGYRYRGPGFDPRRYQIF